MADKIDDENEATPQPEVVESESLAGCWEVDAGVIPGEPIPGYNRRFFYLSKEKEVDLKIPETEPTKFSKLSEEAHQYARELENPRSFNWVRCVWIWF